MIGSLSIVCLTSFDLPKAVGYYWSLQYSEILFQLVVIATGTVALCISLRKTCTFKLNKIDIVLIIFLVYSWINTIIKEQNSSFRSLDIALPTFLTLYFLLKWYFSQKGEYFGVLIKIIVGFGCLNVLISILQLLNIYPIIYKPYLVTGMFNHPAQLAGYLVGTLPFVSSAFFGRPFKSWVLWTVRVLFVVMIIITKSRAAILGTMLLLIICSLPYFVDTLKRRLFFIAIVVFSIIGIGFLMFHFKSDSAKGRLLIWKVGFRMWQTRPLTGGGSNAVEKNYALYQGDYFREGLDAVNERQLARDTTYIFNEPLELLIQQGVIGLLLFLGLVYLIFRTTGGTADPKKKSIIFSLVLLSVFGCFSYPSSTTSINVVVIMAIAYLSKVSGGVNASRQAISYTLIGCVLALSLISFRLIYAFSSTRTWQSAANLWDNDPPRAILAYQNLLPDLQHNHFYMRNYIANLTNAHYYDEAIELYQQKKNQFPNSAKLFLQLGNSFEKKTKNYRRAEKYYLLASEITPGLLTPKYRLFKLYKLTKQIGLAVRQAKIIIATPVIIRNQKDREIRTAAATYLINNR